MSATASDAPAVAARYATDLREGLNLLRVRRQAATHDRIRAATSRAAYGVLRYSEVEADRAAAADALRTFAVERATRRLERDAGALRRHGASITAEQIIAAAAELGAQEASRDLDSEQLAGPRA